MRFFFDNCVPVRLARMLDNYETEHEVRHLTDWFRDDTDDEEWIPEVAARKGPPVVLTADLRIRVNRRERKILRDANLSAFFLTKAWRNLSFHDQAWKLVKVWPLIVENAQLVPEPTIFDVPPSTTKVHLLHRTRDLKV